MVRSSRITSNGGPAGKASAKGASSEGHKSASRRKKDREDNVYAFDEDDGEETKKQDTERRFKGVSVYEYELGDDFEDEEIDEDEAFEVEDYERYGNIGGDGKKRGKGAKVDVSDGADDDQELDDLFGDDGSGSSDDGGDGGAMDDDEAKEAIANGMDPDLAESLGLIAKRKAKSGAAARASVAEESEYAVGGSASGAGRELQLSDLTQPLASSKLLSTSTSTLIKHAQSNKASVPLLGASKAAVIRQEQYEVTKAEVTRWQPEVKKNREASSLSFPLRSQPAPHVSTKTLTADLNPTSSLEADIASLLKGAGEENVQAFEALAMNNMSPEDVRARQAELAKMRSLLFFHEIKCRRIARIKSKKFAKVHKKKKGAAGSNADDDDVDFEEGGDSEAADKRERARIKERMTLKHRNTSKWVTRQLHRGGGKEKGTRQAIEQQLRLAEDLKRKVERLSGSSDDGADGVSGEDEGVDSLREGIENHESDVQHKGLHGMAFMKRARDKGKAQALKLLDEIAAADAGEEAASDDNNAQHGSGRRSFNISAPARQQAASMNTENRSGFHDDDDDDNSGAQFGAEQTRANANAGRKRANAESSSSSSGPPVQLQGGKGLQTLHASLGGSTSLTSTGAVTVVPATASAISNSSRSSRSASRASVSSKTDIGAAVATLPQDNKSEDAASSSAVSSRKKLQRQDNDSNPESFALHNTSNALSNPWLSQPSAAPVSSRGRGDGDQRAAANVLQPMPSADFVREKSNDETAADIEEAFAFAAPDNAEEFQAEKRADIEADAPKVRAFVSLPGWGSWAGAGCVDKYKDTLEARHNARVEQARSKAAASREDSGKAHVILNEKRNKKSVKYMADNFPHVFANREQYESSIRLPLGHEWNTLAAHRTLVKPAVTVKAGKMIKPISVPKSKLRSVGAEKVHVKRKSFLK